MAENNSSAPLLPCPFCGGEADIQSGARGMWNIAGCKDVKCSGFRASGWHDSPNDASAAWNARATQAVAAQAPAAVAVPTFEAWAKTVGGDFARNNCGPYVTDAMKLAGMAWHAALAATPALPAAGDSSAGDLAEAQAEPVAMPLDEHGIAPCPLCGSKSKHVKSGESRGHRILCWSDECECSSGYFVDKEAAISSWNSRAKEGK